MFTKIVKNVILQKLLSRIKEYYIIMLYNQNI